MLLKVINADLVNQRGFLQRFQQEARTAARLDHPNIVAAYDADQAGSLHFLIPGFYLSMMPPWLPWHLELVYLSGVFEVLGGVGLLVPRLRRVACWGLIALLLAVFPANVQYTLNAHAAEGWSLKTIL